MYAIASMMASSSALFSSALVIVPVLVVSSTISRPSSLPVGQPLAAFDRRVAASAAAFRPS